MNDAVAEQLQTEMEGLIASSEKCRDAWNDKGDSHLRVYYEGRRVALCDSLKLIKASLGGRSAAVTTQTQP